MTPWSPEQRALLALARTDNLGGQRVAKLLDHFGSAQAAVAASPQQVQEIAGFGPKLTAALQNLPWSEVDAELAALAEQQLSLLTLADPEYPSCLRQIPSPPVVLTVRGALAAPDRQAVAVVGSRRFSAYGRQMAERLGRGLALAGYTVISGLARGIDAAAHRAAMEAGGRTLAVLASGLARIYPPEHAGLADEVARQGAVLTEAPLTGPPLAELFPRRNRIISGLSLGVVVVEANAKSGALSTAEHALEQNREVFAVPGRATDDGSAGCNNLIRSGAALVTDIDDILEQLGPAPTPPSQPNRATATLAGPQARPKPPPAAAAPPEFRSPLEGRIWSALEEPRDVDTLIELLAVPAPEVAGALTMMELRRLIRREPGNRFSRR